MTNTNTMKAYEFTTWQAGEKWERKNETAIEAGKKFDGTKFTVAFGEWGPTTYLVLGAKDKVEAKTCAIDQMAVDYPQTFDKKAAQKTCVRNVTNCKKYQ